METCDCKNVNYLENTEPPPPPTPLPPRPLARVWAELARRTSSGASRCNGRRAGATCSSSPCCSATGPLWPGLLTGGSQKLWTAGFSLRVPTARKEPPRRCPRLENQVVSHFAQLRPFIPLLTATQSGTSTKQAYKLA